MAPGWQKPDTLIRSVYQDRSSRPSTNPSHRRSVMRRRFVPLIVCGWLLASAAAAPRVMAQERGAAARAAADTALVPFLDDATIGVAKVDVAAIKPEAVQTWFTDQMKAGGAKPDELDRATKGMQEHMVAAKQWQADFAAAGGR